MKSDTVVLSRCPQVRSDIVTGYGDGGAEGVCGGECLDHRRRQLTALAAVTLLKLTHWPAEPPQVEDLDLVRQRHELRPKPVLLLDGKGGDRCRELAYGVRRSPRTAQPEQPESGRRQPGGETTEVGQPCPRQNIAQQVVIDDDSAHSAHLRRGQVWVLEVLYERSMRVGGQRVTEQLLAGAGREKHDRVTEVDDRHSTAPRETPPMSNLCGNTHLAARRHQELSRHRHERSSHLVICQSTKCLLPLDRDRLGGPSRAGHRR